MKNLLLPLLAAASLIVRADDAETSWEHAPTDYKVPPGMVFGGAFIDRILPMPVRDGLESDVWGGDNVKPRDRDNGLEDPDWSYWCMSVLPSGGKEHMFAVRWAEDSPKGHNQWPHSQIVHATSDRPTGPFRVEHEIGPGHNVMCYQAKDGTYVLYAINRAYTSKSLDGPWTPYDLMYDLRGTPGVPMSNHTFTRREDGSVLMVSRGGHVWISEDGLKPFRKITTESAYPKIKGNFEDPVVWRDEVQYNLIVNDWFGRTAYYLRSPDGIRWVWDQGKAYDINVARHEDGTKERWYKFERPNVRQDASGRATHIYFAVIDSRKDLDKGNDNHSSKIIALPLTPQRRLSLPADAPVAQAAGELRVTVHGEPGFRPADEVDVASLTFGAPTEIDFGKGSRALRSESVGEDLVIVFDAASTGFQAADFAGKLLGKTRAGGLLFGYARLPGRCDLQPFLTAREPRRASPETLSMVVENFGQVASVPTELRVTFKPEGAPASTATATVSALAPYGAVEITVPMPAGLPGADKPCPVEIFCQPAGASPSLLKTKI